MYPKKIDLLTKGHAFEGEPVVLDDAGRVAVWPRPPDDVVFDLLMPTALICGRGRSESARLRFTGRPLGEINSLWITQNTQRWLARGVPI
jgi:hypothetical protein